MQHAQSPEITSETVSTTAPLAQDALSRQLLELAERVAQSDVTVMLTGESGVGKEVYARYIHRCSARQGGPFIALNCAAIPESMLEAVLFGHEKGAFTGASDARPGKFELAHRGTLLLDEVTEMALGLQAKLLRVLQEREVERVGGQSPKSVDVRVIATSNRDLRSAVADGVLREDLYYRLNVFPLHVPPLRQRRRDILPLAHRLARRHFSGAELPTLSAEACRALLQHQWPGNVRELENVMQRALVLAQDGRIDADALALDCAPLLAADPVDVDEIQAHEPAEASPAPEDNNLDQHMKSHEGELILRALEATDGRRNQAAARLGISPRTLRYKLARLRELGMALPS
jgi:two-component system, response regulator FlrC